VEQLPTATGPSQGAVAGRQRPPGDPGLWALLSADLALFGLFFVIFMTERAKDVPLFEASRQQLDPAVGLVNTMFLLTGSWCLVHAVEAARERRTTQLGIWLALALVAGSGFGVLKLSEYVGKSGHGISMLTNDFFTYYFVFTGVHYLHFVIGMVAILILLLKVRGGCADASWPHRVRWVETVACYWHVVDILWLMLFPVLYLLRA